MRFLIPLMLLGLAAAGCATTESTIYTNAVEAFNEVKNGDEAVKRGDIDTAIKHYEKALKLAPEAPKNRFGYAQLLYWKGLSYVQECQTAFQKSLGALSGDSLKEWLNGPAKLSDEEKRELQNRDNECRRRGESYFKKALEELTRCDADWGYAVEAVAFAKGIVNLVMERFGYANGEFKRVLESKRTSEETKREVKALIEKITQYQRELGKEEKEAEDEKKEGE
jgi:tetratricopeptide (TPR) repeat protein